MIKFWSICRNTFIQTIRQPIYCVLLATTFGVLVLSLPLTGWTLGGNTEDYHETDQKMLENLGISTLLISGMLFAAFSASTVLSREIEEKTALTVISKPVSRTTFVLGKFAGVAAAVTAAFYLCVLVFLMTVRHRVMSAVTDPYDWPVITLGLCALVVTLVTALAGNYLFGWTFTSSSVYLALVSFSAAMGVIAFIGKGWKVVPFGQDIRPQLIIGIVLIYMGVLIFSAAAVTASTRLGPVLTLLVCFGVLFVGWLHPWLFRRKYADIAVVKFLSWIAPNLTYFDPQDPLTSDKDIPLKFLAMAAAYAGCYITAILSFGVALFQTRQLEARTTSAAAPGAVGILAWLGRLLAAGMVIVALAMPSLETYRNLRGIGIAAGLFAGGAGLWILAGCLARGAQWSYWLVLSATTLFCFRSLAGLIYPPVGGVLRLTADHTLLFVQTAGGAVVLAVLLLPKTRRHFIPPSSH